MSDAESDAVGLCARCRHARVVETARSQFWLCDRSRYDSSYTRYPRLPMRACPGHEPGTPLPWRGGEVEPGGPASD